MVLSVAAITIARGGLLCLVLLLRSRSLALSAASSSFRLSHCFSSLPSAPLSFIGERFDWGLYSFWRQGNLLTRLKTKKHHSGNTAEFKPPHSGRVRLSQTGDSENDSGISEMSSAPSASILWFRKGLRLHDNYALLEACKEVKHVFPIFILDPWFIEPSNVGIVRYNFLLECLADLDSSLRARHNSRLIVLRGQPSKVFEKILSDPSFLCLDKPVSKICFEKDTEPYALKRDKQIIEMAKAKGVQCHDLHGHTLFDLDLLMDHCNYNVPMQYGSFNQLIEKVGLPAKPLEEPKEIPPPPPSFLSRVENEFPLPSLEDEDIKKKYEEELKDYKHPALTGGEAHGLEILEKVTKQENWVAQFEKPQTSPVAFKPASTTKLSAYMKFGAVSSRRFFHAVRAINLKKPGHSKPPGSLLGQLLFREQFYLVSYGVPNFDKMKGNPKCKQIDWDDNPEFLSAWAEARTGYPWIDAIMTQLRKEGWIHHLARHSVACFLTRGDLYCSWEDGAKIFDRYLIDADWALNNANWQWLSASCFFYQFFRVYSPVAFGKKYDKEGKYVRHFLTVLKNMPTEFIYEPWKAPKAVQERAGCVVGRDYPKPIVDHDVIHKKNLDRMKAAYDRQKGISSGGGGGGAAAAPAAAAGVSKGVKRASPPAAAAAPAAKGRKQREKEESESEESEYEEEEDGDSDYERGGKGKKGKGKKQKSPAKKGSTPEKRNTGGGGNAKKTMQKEETTSSSARGGAKKKGIAPAPPSSSSKASGASSKKGPAAAEEKKKSPAAKAKAK
uniref:Photolyase/cryptochrome alpha/beta domain-containing protein n=1 Tax=Chromera velia CCMP2878 TaxID=1169474 RepID=A0A0G4HKP3_9ALVE|eukprot:Cvel_7245.t1-p1 / transcript=Cvel_7245.t1 / gene=Cvel_7245 / organism=Chromera_velia_CCMP2878 / gene_product=(6-4)DNA photolyase, putative / transcript_product=(6-4)DNA photolyase, putative / location=Cvel_scaffold374:8355-14446(-) / protein_length=781 / sequence_SO=supercontig / SO=protein_coding / is_pseudo=false